MMIAVADDEPVRRRRAAARHRSGVVARIERQSARPPMNTWPAAETVFEAMPGEIGNEHQAVRFARNVLPHSVQSVGRTIADIPRNGVEDPEHRHSSDTLE